MAHLSAWNWEHIKEINRVLEERPIWNKHDDPTFDDAFNKRAVEKRKNKSLKEITEEWENSFDFLIKRIEKLSAEEWEYECKSEKNPQPL